MSYQIIIPKPVQKQLDSLPKTKVLGCKEYHQLKQTEKPLKIAFNPFQRV